MLFKKVVAIVRALLHFIHKTESQHLNWVDAGCAVKNTVQDVGTKVHQEYNE